MRCNELFEELKNRCQKLDEDKIDKDFLESDEFIALLTGILESLRKTHNKEKITRFVNILLRSSEKNHSDDYYKERFIQLVDETSEVHILILELFRAGELLEDVAGAEVTFQHESLYQLTFQTRTGADGTVIMHDIPEGRYRYTAEPYLRFFSSGVPLCLER